ncbi:MAG: hypothetical protein EZS28_052252, partial [Streblomastix strix]
MNYITEEDRHHVLDRLAKTEDDMINGRIEDKDMNRWKIDAISDIIEDILMSNEYSKKKINQQKNRESKDTKHMQGQKQQWIYLK